MRKQKKTKPKSRIGSNMVTISMRSPNKQMHIFLQLTIKM